MSVRHPCLSVHTHAHTHAHTHTHTLQHHTHRHVHTLPSGARNGPEPSVLGWGPPAASHGGKVSWRTMRPLFYHPRSQKEPLLGWCAPQGRLSTVSPGGCACVWERKAGCSLPRPTCSRPPTRDPTSSRASCLVLQTSRGLTPWPTSPLGLINSPEEEVRVTRGRAWWSKCGM